MSMNLFSWKPMEENQGALLPGRIDITSALFDWLSMNEQCRSLCLTSFTVYLLSLKFHVCQCCIKQISTWLSLIFLSLLSWQWRKIRRCAAKPCETQKCSEANTNFTWWVHQVILANLVEMVFPVNLLNLEIWESQKRLNKEDVLSEIYEQFFFSQSFLSDLNMESLKLKMRRRTRRPKSNL